MNKKKLKREFKKGLKGLTKGHAKKVEGNLQKKIDELNSRLSLMEEKIKVLEK